MYLAKALCVGSFMPFSSASKPFLSTWFGTSHLMFTFSFRNNNVSMFQYMSGAMNVEGNNILSLIEKREKVRYNVIKLVCLFLEPTGYQSFL